MRRFARAAIEVVRLACARERLEEAPPAPHRSAQRDRRRILRALFAIEPLEGGEAAAPAPRGTARRDPRLFRALFAIEPLGIDEPGPPAPRRGSWVRWLFFPERLPHDPAPPRARRSSRLAALFAPERLDDSPEDSP